MTTRQCIVLYKKIIVIGKSECELGPAWGVGGSCYGDTKGGTYFVSCIAAFNLTISSS